MSRSARPFLTITALASLALSALAAMCAPLAFAMPAPDHVDRGTGSGFSEPIVIESSADSSGFELWSAVVGAASVLVVLLLVAGLTALVRRHRATQLRAA